MRATVREYTEKRKVVVVEFDVEDAEKLLDGPAALNGDGRASLAYALAAALEADRAEEQRREDEDVPF